MITRCVNGLFFSYSCRKQRYLLNISLTFAHIPYVFYITITFHRYIYFNIIFLRYANDLLLKVIPLFLTYGLYILTRRFLNDEYLFLISILMRKRNLFRLSYLPRSIFEYALSDIAYRCGATSVRFLPR